MVLRRTYKFYSSCPEKKQLCKCSRSTAAVAWVRATAGEAEAGLAAAETLSAWVWLEEIWLVYTGHLVKRVEVYINLLVAHDGL